MTLACIDQQHAKFNIIKPLWLSCTMLTASALEMNNGPAKTSKGSRFSRRELDHEKDSTGLLGPNSKQSSEVSVSSKA